MLGAGIHTMREVSQVPSGRLTIRPKEMPFEIKARAVSGAVEAAVSAEIDVLDDGRLAQPGLAQATGEPLILAAGHLAIDEQSEPILATELTGIGGILQLEKGIGHGGEAERSQALDSGVDQHRISWGQW